jgi:hypothetical protein
VGLMAPKAHRAWRHSPRFLDRVLSDPVGRRGPPAGFGIALGLDGGQSPAGPFGPRNMSVVKSPARPFGAKRFTGQPRHHRRFAAVQHWVPGLGTAKGLLFGSVKPVAGRSGPPNPPAVCPALFPPGGRRRPSGPISLPFSASSAASSMRT